MQALRHPASLLIAFVLAGCGAGGGASSTTLSALAVATAETTVQPTPAPSGPASAPEPELGQVPVGPTERATVVRIVDGDTIVVDRGQGAEKLRYIGVDTPETAQPNTPIQFMGEEAAAANRALVDGREVLLERDLTEYDRYGRLLRYVWVDDPSAPSGWLLVNLALVAQGFAQVVTYPPDVRYVDLYLDAQQTAREQGHGLWSEASVPSPTPAPSGIGGFVADPRAGCDQAYPDVCIPPPPPDLDCGDIGFRRFAVVAPDPHRFDSDGDGIGCEGG